MDDGTAAWKYHEATKHSELSLRRSGHYLDWDNKPAPFKVYHNIPSIPLPRDFPHPREQSLATIKTQRSGQKSKTLELDELAEILFFSAGLTRKMRFGSEVHYMRAASATGALYPIELYIISSGIDGLDPGAYHFNPLSFSLVRIREGDYSAELADATADATNTSPVTIVFTSLAWRNAWKYEARSYRHWFWDAGVIAANLLATSSSEQIKSKLLMAFNDHKMDQLLGLKPQQEATVALAPIGESKPLHAIQGTPAVTILDLDTEPLSREQVEYPIMWETNKASELQNRADIESWRNSLKKASPSERGSDPYFPIQSSKKNTPTLAEVILRRGSTRKFAQRPISFDVLSTVIDASTGPIPLDFLSKQESLVEFYLIANDVENLPSGAYYFDRANRSLRQLKEGKLRYVSGYLCLEQLLFSDASVVFFLMADLHRVLTSLGSRGYRAAQFEAGIRAGKIYLSSYAEGIGASGSTFYDDAVTEFFSPHAEHMSAMIAVGIGVPAYEARPGRVLTSA
ncbi:SagB/ThcOx family dehydrogenase [Candidatus Bathyarchaeota archaeon]|nr:SagB/ThcOx family dehydrogenase [Candidatus Bathyarchaeota archaeon]